MLRVCILLMVLVPFAGAGAQAPKPAGDTVKVQMSPRDCQRLVRHRARDDVDFKPGVDVRGRPVAPADLPGSTATYRQPDMYEFVVALNPLEGTEFTETTLPQGVVKFDTNTGRLTFNGTPLGEGLQDALAEQCRGVGPN